MVPSSENNSLEIPEESSAERVIRLDPPWMSSWTLITGGSVSSAAAPATSTVGWTEVSKVPSLFESYARS